MRRVHIWPGLTSLPEQQQLIAKPVLCGEIGPHPERDAHKDVPSSSHKVVGVSRWDSTGRTGSDRRLATRSTILGEEMTDVYPPGETHRLPVSLEAIIVPVPSTG
jgi:hypothetical protein